MRKLVYLVACTADGFIAGEDGSFDFFPASGEHLPYLAREYPETIPGHLRDTLGAHSENRSFDTVLMGRRTYEVGLTFGVTSPYSHLRQVVVSRTMSASPDPRVQLADGDPVSLDRKS